MDHLNNVTNNFFCCFAGLNTTEAAGAEIATNKPTLGIHGPIVHRKTNVQVPTACGLRTGAPARDKSKERYERNEEAVEVARTKAKVAKTAQFSLDDDVATALHESEPAQIVMNTSCKKSKEDK